MTFVGLTTLAEVVAPISALPLLPTDIISYALGLLTTMPTSQYLVASAIGITGSALLYVSAAALPLPLQVVAGLLLLIVFFLS